MQVEADPRTSRSAGNVWRTLFFATLIIFALVFIRAATRTHGGVMTTGDSGGILARTRFTCKGANGNLHGECADSWWDHFWHDLDYCSSVEAACKAGGGVYTTE